HAQGQLRTHTDNRLRPQTAMHAREQPCPPADTRTQCCAARPPPLLELPPNLSNDPTPRCVTKEGDAQWRCISSVPNIYREGRAREPRELRPTAQASAFATNARATFTTSLIVRTSRTRK